MDSSHNKELNSGAPQGSVLLNLFTNDLQLEVNAVVAKFVADT